MLADISPWIEKPAQLLAVVVGVGFLIFVHELGHFLAAKAYGVRVERFAIGLWRKVVGFKRGDTEYALCLIPFGGYVKMAGEYPGQEHKGEDYEFYSKPPGKRAVIVLAGVVMNAIIATFTFIAAFRAGVWLRAAEIEPIPGRAAWVAGIREGDVVLGIDGDKVNTFTDLAQAVAMSEGDVTLKLRRDGQVFTRRLTPKENPEMGFRTIGVMPRSTLTVAAALPGRKGGKREIRKGDALVEAQGEELISWNHFRRIVSKRPGKPLRVALRRPVGAGHQEMTVTVVPDSVGGWDLGCVTTDGLYLEKVRRGGPAWRGGIRDGDTIVSLNGSPTGGWRRFREIIAVSAGKTVSVGIERGSGGIDVDVEPEYDPVDDRAFIGVTFDLEPVVGAVAAGSPAERIGLEPRDRITAVRLEVDGRDIEIESWRHFENAIGASNGKELTLSWDRGGKIFREKITPQRNEERAAGFLGLVPEMKLIEIHLGLAKAVCSGMRDSYMWGKRIIETLLGLITGKVSGKAISGPVGIPIMGMYYVERGFGTFLYFLSILGINFAVLNILPLPVVDGGVLTLLGLEKLRGRPLSLKTQTVIQQVGIAILIVILLLVTIQDVPMVIERIAGWFAG